MTFENSTLIGRVAQCIPAACAAPRRTTCTGSDLLVSTLVCSSFGRFDPFFIRGMRQKERCDLDRCWARLLLRFFQGNSLRISDACPDEF